MISCSSPGVWFSICPSCAQAVPCGDMIKSLDRSPLSNRVAIATHIDFDLMRREVARLALSFGLEAAPPRDILTGVADFQARLREVGRDQDAERFRVEAFEMLREIEIEHCGTPVIIEGASQVLRALEERGIRVGVVTRNCRPVAMKLLARGDLKCRCLLTRDDVPRTKPDPSHLLAALRPLDVGDPASSLMVGDHFMDVHRGRAAGTRTVGVLYGKPSTHFDVCPPDLLVERLGDLLGMLESLS